MDAILTPPVRLAETLGTRLRRLARDADRGNPTANLPWKVPPSYAQGEAIKANNVRAANGGWYVALTTATTVGASGPSHISAQAVADGSGGALWGYLGPAPMTADDALAPTVAISGSTSLPNRYRPGEASDRFAAYGGTPTLFGANFSWQFPVFDSKTGTTVQGRAALAEFMIDDNQFEIEHGGGLPAISLVIDDRFLTLDAYAPAATEWIKVTIPGGRRPHRIQVRGHNLGWTLQGIRVGANSQIYHPGSDGAVRAVFLEDSFAAGSNYSSFVSGKSLHRQFGDLVGIKDMWSLSQGGRGYIAKGSDGSYDTYKQSLAQAVSLKPDIVFLAGSTNDRGQPAGTAFAATPIAAADITAAALDTYRTLRGLGYRGPIVVFGVGSIDDSAVSAAQKIAYVEQAIADAVTAFADPLTWFVPVRNDPAGPWVSGSWNYGTQTSSTNSAIITNTDAGDKTHPGDLGVAYYAARRAATFRRAILTRLP